MRTGVQWPSWVLLLDTLQLTPRTTHRSPQEVNTMDIEEVFEQIGQLGRAQANLFVMLSLPGPWISFHTFITNFIGSDPGWNCTLIASQFLTLFQSELYC